MNTRGETDNPVSHHLERNYMVLLKSKAKIWTNYQNKFFFFFAKLKEVGL